LDARRLTKPASHSPRLSDEQTSETATIYVRAADVSAWIRGKDSRWSLVVIMSA
jgi:hypothetical protein